MCRGFWFAPQPSALVVLSDIGKANEDASLAALQNVVGEVNSTLESHEKLDGVIVASDDWTIESGLLTPTLKLQRTAIEKKYNGLWDDKSIKGIQKEAAIG